jgi:hypothetical protein
MLTINLFGYYKFFKKNRDKSESYYKLKSDEVRKNLQNVESFTWYQAYLLGSEVGGH